MTAPASQSSPRTATRVEYFGRLQVHQPVPAPKPQENTK